MNIVILEPQDGMDQKSDLFVVIDVFRAFTTACYIMEQNPERYVPVSSIDEALSLRNSFSNCVLIGERNGRKAEGFDLGNSPTEVVKTRLSGKICIHYTTGGTTGLTRPTDTCEAITGSFVNEMAVKTYIESRGFESIILYCTSERGYAEEDYELAQYLKNDLERKKQDFEAIRARLEQSSGRGILEGTYAPATDFNYCMDLDRFGFILKREEIVGTEWKYELKKVDVL